MSKIEMGKTYRTRDGREVRIYAVGDFGVHGAVLEDGGWQVCGWHADGGWSSPSRAERHDLIEHKPTITRTCWAVHLAVPYATAANYRVDFDDEEMAREWARGSGKRLNPIAITGPHSVTFTPGEGL